MAIQFGDQPFTGMLPGGGEQELHRYSEVGKRFYVPDAQARARLEGYAEAEQLLDVEEHVKAWCRITNQAPGSDTQKHWIPLDFPGMLARLMRHYGLGEEFGVKAVLRGTVSGNVSGQLADAQATVDRIAMQTRLTRTFRQVLEALPTYGDAVLRMDVVSGEDELSGETIPMARVRFVPAFNYFPMLDPLDAATASGVTLAWVFKHPNQDLANGEGVLVREENTPGQVRYLFNQWDGSKVGEPITREALRTVPGLESLADLEDYQTGIDEVPIIHVGWQVKGGEHFGSSELLRVARIILALENRLAQEDEALEKHARPKLIVGPGILDEHGKSNLKDFDVIEVSPDVFEKAVKPEYLTWDMQVNALQHEIEKLEEYLFMTTETSPASFGLERDGSQVESARALRFKAHRTVNKVQDIRVDLRLAIASVFRIGQKLELAARQAAGLTGFRRALVDVKFGDPIVEDQEQEVLDYVARKGAGLVSVNRALMDLDGLSPEEAELERRRILQDQVDAAAAATATLGGEPPREPGQGDEEDGDMEGEPEETEPEPEV